METENTVSIWIGNFADQSQLDHYLQIRYDEDGEAVPSQFLIDNGIDLDDIDDDLIEAEFYDVEHSNLEQMIKGASYDQTILRNLKLERISTVISPSNTIILLYNYDCSGNKIVIENIRFIGTVRYKET
ncbi:immunity 22 family protein [Streptococcus oralis]|uniref:immunity 22 family protein n=1 Tax=Streptococcus oralis TaxID=1303 RepID=UPI0002583F25|nr:immunity 22 family protein [Streptococcus oralis]EIC76808.1 PF14112 domain protein [Streptococcus oralis SK100]KZX08081.1 hypothetical protein A4224_06160 [Streptococcus oralis]